MALLRRGEMAKHTAARGKGLSSRSRSPEKVSKGTSRLPFGDLDCCASQFVPQRLSYLAGYRALDFLMSSSGIVVIDVSFNRLQEELLELPSSITHRWPLQMLNISSKMESIYSCSNLAESVPAGRTTMIADAWHVPTTAPRHGQLERNDHSLATVSEHAFPKDLRRAQLR